MTNGEKIIKAKAVERLKGDSETTEQRKAVTVGTAIPEPSLPSPTRDGAAGIFTCSCKKALRWPGNRQY